MFTTKATQNNQHIPVTPSYTNRIIRNKCGSLGQRCRKNRNKKCLQSQFTATDGHAYNNEIERRVKNNNMNNQKSNSVTRRGGVLGHQPLILLVSSLEMRSEGVIQHQPSTEAESIFLNVEANEIVRDPVEVVDFPLINVGNDEVIEIELPLEV